MTRMIPTLVAGAILALSVGACERDNGDSPGTHPDDSTAQSTPDTPSAPS